MSLFYTKEHLKSKVQRVCLLSMSVVLEVVVLRDTCLFLRRPSVLSVFTIVSFQRVVGRCLECTVVHQRGSLCTSPMALEDLHSLLRVPVFVFVRLFFFVGAARKGVKRIRKQKGRERDDVLIRVD